MILLESWKKSHRLKMNRWIKFLNPFITHHGLRMPTVASILDNAIRFSSFGDSETLLTEKNIHFLQQEALGFRQQ